MQRPGKCPKCKTRGDKLRPNAHQRLYTAEWNREAKLFRHAEPFCVCGGQIPGCNGIAKETDHIIPHNGDEKLFWDRSNWQNMSKHCHSLKTAKEDGGFGNQISTREGAA